MSQHIFKVFISYILKHLHIHIFILISRRESAYLDSKIRESSIREKIRNVDEEMRLKRHLSTDSEASAAGGGSMEQSKKYKAASVSEIELSDGEYCVF